VSTPVTKLGPQTGAGLLVKSLEAQGVEYVFGIPGAKIDKVFDTLLDSTIKTVVCRHEQNAAFIFQEMSKYGRDSGVEFGPVDVVPFAEAFGAKGLRIERPDQIAPTLKKALAMQGPVVIGIPVDYRDNHRLMEIVHPNVLN
jgi:thiamine pyrophosphate-dependent acetolactate synthase large subunit-like protein